MESLMLPDGSLLPAGDETYACYREEANDLRDVFLCYDDHGD